VSFFVLSKQKNMTNTQKFLNELEQEANTTRKMLSIVPDDKLDWQPHPKSMTIRRLATHIAELPGWVSMALDTEGLDLANNPYEKPVINSRAELLDYYEQELTKGRASLLNAKDADLAHLWTFSNEGKVISERPKDDVIRMSLNQTVHHRAQLGVFLRLLNVPIPGSYGPSADELGM